MEWSGGVIGVS